jgi:hypothetical protein
MPERPEALLDELTAYYARAQKRLEHAVRTALERGNIGTEVYRRRQLQAVDALLAQLRRHGPARADALVRAAYSTAALAVDRALGLEAAFSGVHETAVLLLAQNAIGRLDGAVTLIGRRTVDVFRAVALQEVAVGVAAGDTRRQVSAAIEKHLVEERVADAVTGFVDRAGRRWGLDHYAQMVARTTTREAMTTATVARMTDHELDLVTISDHGTTTPICQEFEGNTYSLTGKTPGYEVIAELPPFHPGCQHVVTPAGANFEDFERALMEA